MNHLHVPNKVPDHLRSLVLQSIFVILTFAILFIPPLLGMNYKPVDWQHYIEAASRIAHRISPYNDLEFFYPPWFAIILTPLLILPHDVAAILWLLVGFISLFCSIFQWGTIIKFPTNTRNKFLLSIAMILSPPAFYIFITGQASAVVILGLVYLFSLSHPSNKFSRFLLVFLCILGITTKPHLVALPFILYLLENIRLQQWHLLFMIFISLISLCIVSTIIYPPWWLEWFKAILGGDFRGGIGLVAKGYYGLREAGIPSFILALPALYTMIYWLLNKDFVHVFSLAIVSNLILIPYSRTYDLVVLYPVCLYVLQLAINTPWKFIIQVILIVSICIIPLSQFALLIPVLVMICLLISCLMTNKILSYGFNWIRR